MNRDPKYKKGDLVICKDRLSDVYKEVGTIEKCSKQNNLPYPDCLPYEYWVNFNWKLGVSFTLQGWFEECQLEPYTESETTRKNPQNLSLSDNQNTDNMEEKELNLCELLKDCIYETFYSPICGECEYKECFEDSEKMLFESIKDGVDGGYASLVFDAEGRYGNHGICMLYPSKELYEKYPLDPRKAWSEWAENRKPKHILQAQIRLISNDGITIEDSEIVEVEVWDISFNHAVKVVERTFEQFHKRKEADQ